MPTQRSSRESAIAGAASIVAVSTWWWVEIIRQISERKHYIYQGGDQAIIQMAARKAAHLTQLVGPYSRFGFHHPGPFMFYLLAPFEAMFGGNGAGIDIGVLVINWLAGLGVVILIWRRFGGCAALGAAAIVDLLCLSLGFVALRYPWNPYVIPLTVLLFAVVWSDAWAGSAAAFAWAAVVATFDVQTHISTLPFCLVMLAAVLFVRFRKRDWTGFRQPAFLAGAVVFVIAWIPPFADLFADSPNNLSAMWHYVRHPGSGPSPISAAHQAINALTVVPFTYSVGPNELIRRGVLAGLAGLLLVVFLGAAAVVVGRRSREPVVSALAWAGVAGAVLGTIGNLRATGGAFGYLVVWMSFVPAAFLIAIIVSSTGSGTSPARPPRLLAVAAAGAAITVGFSVHNDLAQPPAWQSWNIAAAAQLLQGADSYLQAGDHALVVDFADDNSFLEGAGLVAQLVSQNHRIGVSPARWLTQFGPGFGAPTGAHVRLTISDTSVSQLDPSAGQVIARADPIVLQASRS